jgi:hypothetical protein
MQAFEIYTVIIMLFCMLCKINIPSTPILIL